MVAMSPRQATPVSAAYTPGALAMFIAAGGILTALAFEHIGGYAPCPLCLQQRYAYYAGVPAAFVSLALLSGGHRKLAAAGLLLVALAFLANAGLGIYHAGAEWKFWPGPASCGTLQAIGSGGGGLLDQLNATRVIACDEAALRIFGLSFAGWNVVVSFVVFVLALQAAFRARGDA